MKQTLFFLLSLFFCLSLLTSCKKYQPDLGEIPESVELTEKSDYFTLFPKTPCDSSNCATLGIMFYPGAYVKPKAYAEMLSYWAEAGYKVIIVKMPSDLAVLAPQKAIKYMEDFPEISHWVISGHSLGGAMASDVIAKHTDTFDGLILLGSYPNKSIKDVDIAALSISAEFDQLTTAKDIEDSKAKLPDNTQFVEIKGGNHGQFGSYGVQKKDGTATISREEQHTMISEAVIPFLDAL